MENNQEIKKFDNFGNEYVVYDGGHLKSVNGNTVEGVEHLYSNIDDTNMNPEYQEKEGQNKTALIFVDTRERPLVLNLHNDKKIRLSTQPNADHAVVSLTTDRDLTRLHNCSFTKGVQAHEIIKENGNTEYESIDRLHDATITYYYPPIKNGQKSQQITHIARKGFKPMIRDNAGDNENRIMEFFDVNKDEYYKGKVGSDGDLTKYHKIGKNKYQKDWAVKGYYTNFCGSNKKCKELYLLTEHGSPIFSIVNSDTGRTKITRDIPFKYGGHQPSLIIDELNMNSLETHQQHWDRMNKFYNKKAQKVRDNIEEPLPLQPERSKSV